MGGFRIADCICCFSQVFKLDWVIMSICILCVVATILYGALNALERLYLRRH